MSPHPIPRGDAGLTLIELIVVIVLLGILTAVGSSMISNSFTTSIMLDKGNVAEAGARYALERIGRELREMEYVDSATGYASLGDVNGIALTTQTPPASGLCFKRLGTETVAGSVTGSPLTVVLGLSGKSLKLNHLDYSANCPGDITNSPTLLDEVSAFTLIFRDASGAVISPISNKDIQVQAAFVDIRLTVGETGAVQKDYRPLTQTLRVALRNQ